MRGRERHESSRPALQEGARPRGIAESPADSKTPVVDARQAAVSNAPTGDIRLPPER